jgi:hypothetical protein
MDASKFTFSELEAKKALLLEELNSDEQNQITTYGDHDPFSVPILRCDKCGEDGLLKHERHSNGNFKYFVQCTGCGNFHKTMGKSPELGILLWNIINPNGFYYARFPLFGISGLSPEEAKDRMMKIRRNLEIRDNLAVIEVITNPVVGQQKPAIMYKKRIKLYLHWAIWAQAAIRAQLPQKYRKKQHLVEPGNESVEPNS